MADEPPSQRPGQRPQGLEEHLMPVVVADRVASREKWKPKDRPTGSRTNAELVVRRQSMAARHHTTRSVRQAIRRRPGD